MKRRLEYRVANGEIIIASVWLTFFAVVLMATVVIPKSSAFLVSLASR